MIDIEQPEKEEVSKEKEENKNLFSETLQDTRQMEKKPEERKEEEGGKKAPENNSVDPNGIDSRPVQNFQKDMSNDGKKESLPTDIEKTYPD